MLLSSQGEVIADGLLSSAVADADIVLEAVNENISIKNSIFRGIIIVSITLCLGAHAQARYTVVCCVCVDCYSCSKINKVQVRVSIGF